MLRELKRRKTVTTHMYKAELNRKRVRKCVSKKKQTIQDLKDENERLKKEVETYKNKYKRFRTKYKELNRIKFKTNVQEVNRQQNPGMNNQQNPIVLFEEDIKTKTVTTDDRSIRTIPSPQWPGKKTTERIQTPPLERGSPELSSRDIRTQTARPEDNVECRYCQMKGHKWYECKLNNKFCSFCRMNGHTLKNCWFKQASDWNNTGNIGHSSSHNTLL